MRKLMICTLVALLAVPAAAQLSFLGIKNSMVQFLFDQLSTEGEFEIKAETVEEPEDGVTAITGLTIADADGVWFRAGSLDFAWSPSRLLLGEIEFSNLAMRDVRVLRQPISQPEVEVDTEEEPGELTIAWPRSPLTLRIERLALENTVIAEPVLGHALAFDATGSAQDEGDIQAVTLNLTRTDQVEGVINFDYERRFDTNTFRLHLDAREGPQGLIAALSGLPSDAASEAKIDADGPPEDWKMTLSVALADTLNLGGDAAISYEGPLKVDARLEASAGPKLDPDLAALLGTGAQLEAKATEGENGVIQIERGFLSAPDIDLTASGTYDRTSGAPDLAVDLQARSGLAAPVDGVDFEGFSFKGTVKGAPGELAADGDLGLVALRTDAADVAEATLAVDIRQSPGPTPEPEPVAEGEEPIPAEPITTTSFAVAGATLGLRLDKIGPDVLGDPRLDITGALTGQELTLEDARLDSDILLVQIMGLVDLESQDAQVELDLDAPEFGPVAGAYGVELDGRLAARVRATMLDGTLDASLTSELADFTHELGAAESLSQTVLLSYNEDRALFDIFGQGTQMRVDKIRPELLGDLVFASRGKLVGDELTLEASEVSSNLLRVSAEGRLNIAGTTGEVRYSAATADLEPITALYDVPLSGRAAADGTAFLAEFPRIEGIARVDGIVFDGTAYGDLRLSHDMEVGPNPQGDLALTLAESPYGKVEAATSLRFEAPVLELTGLDLKALGARATGVLTLDTEQTLADGAIKLDIASLKPLAGLAGTPLAGSISGEITLAHAGGRQDAKARLAARRLVTDGAAVERVNVDASLTNLLGTPGINARVAATGVGAGEVVLDTTDIMARGPLSALDIALDLAGKLGEDPLSASLKGRADGEGPVTGARLSLLEADLGGETLSLNQPMTVRAEGSRISVRNLDLTLPRGASLVGEITKAGNALIGELTLEDLDATLAKRFADAPVLAGTVSAEAVFNTGRGPADIRLDATGMQFENVDVEGDLDLATSVTWDGRRAALQGAISGGFGDPFQFEGSIPLRPGLVPSVPSRGPVEGRVQWQGEIGDLWALVPAAGHILSGQMNIDLAVSGDISDPQLGGQVALTEGGYQNLDLGTILTDLSLTTQAEPGGALGFALNASDGGNGKVSTEGSVALDASGLDVKTVIESAVLVRRDEATARVDGEITVGGPMTALKVDGDIALEAVEVRLVSNASANIVTLGDVRIKGAPEPEEDTAEGSIDLRLDITSPGRIFVRGRGLDSTWGLDLKIRGTAAKPRLTGAVERVRGRLDLIGKGFDLARGKITFDGGPEIDPRLDIMFERETADLTGRIIVDGRASDPKLSFSSSPSLPEDEVLPRTIFGKSSQALTGSQAIQLALGLATLLDGGGGTLDQVRGAVGLDQLRVEQDEDGNASVAAGKEVSEGVFIGAKQSLGSGESSVIVEVDVFEGISVDAEVGQQSGPTIGLRWKKDF
ncbi:MAG: translocation/assembly module TamB domain-containing protein [Pseudomonadota bacterium]